MMFMPDCLKATQQLMEAPNENLTQRVYNVTAFSFTPEQLANSIRKYMPNFQITYNPDYKLRYFFFTNSSHNCFLNLF